MHPQENHKERIPLMANKPYLSNTIRGYTLITTDKSEKPHLDTSTPLFWRHTGTRIDTRIAAEVSTVTGNSMTGTIVAIFENGLQLLGNRQLADCMQAGILRFFRCKPAKLTVRFTLPSNLDPFEVVSVRCEAVYMRRTRHGQTRISLRFLDFSGGQETLAEYLLYRAAIG